MELFERVRLVAKEFAGSETTLAKLLGLQQARFNYYFSLKTQHKLWVLLPKIMKLYPSINRDWLYFDEGKMDDPQKNITAQEAAELKAKIADLEKKLQDADNINRNLTNRIFVQGFGNNVESNIHFGDQKK